MRNIVLVGLIMIALVFVGDRAGAQHKRTLAPIQKTASHANVKVVPHVVTPQIAAAVSPSPAVGNTMSVGWFGGRNCLRVWRDGHWVLV